MRGILNSAGYWKLALYFTGNKARTVGEECGISQTRRVQKKSRLHVSEPKDNFPLYDVFEEGFEICINSPVSAKFLYNATSTVKGITHLQ